MDIEGFNTQLLDTNTECERLNFIRKIFFHGIPHVFKDRENEYFEFRNKIAKNFGISFHEVFIVGSAKLGFSYIKNKDFDYDSDVDVVIVNEKLFDKYYDKIGDYQYLLDKNHRTVDLSELKEYSLFLRYLVKGWMRPDKLPISFQTYILKKEWFDFFNSISNNKSEVGDYQVRAGLYKNYHYIEKYYKINIKKQYNILKLNKE